jgi:hypothetical protein
MIPTFDKLRVRYTRQENGIYHQVENLFSEREIFDLPNLIKFEKPFAAQLKRFDQLCVNPSTPNKQMVSGLMRTDHRRFFYGDLLTNKGKRLLVFIFNKDASEVEIQLFPDRRYTDRLARETVVSLWNNGY